MGRGSSKVGGGGFHEGATPKDIKLNRSYTVEKTTSKGTSNYGLLPGSDTRSLLKGYKYNGLFWEKNGTTAIFTIKEKPRA